MGVIDFSAKQKEKQERQELDEAKRVMLQALELATQDERVAILEAFQEQDIEKFRSVMTFITIRQCIIEGPPK